MSALGLEAQATPRVTFFLFAYNQEATVREACLAALAQDYSNLEIVFSDDCSRDATFGIMEEVAAAYCGQHTLRLNRNSRNLGLIGHVNEAMRIASGELVVAAAGDDVSLPERTGALVSAWLASGRTANSIHSSVTKIDREGRTLGLMTPPILEQPGDLESVAISHRLVIGATHAWTRRVFDVFGPIAEPETYEDLVIVFRSRLLGPIAYVDRPLVNYRYGVGLSATPPKPSNRDGAKADFARRTALKASTLAQRCIDCRRVGRPIPARLARAEVFEAVRREVAHGGLQGGWRVLQRRPLQALAVIRAFLSAANELRRAKRHFRKSGA